MPGSALARFRPLPPPPIPENRTLGIRDFRQPPTVVTRIGNRRVTVKQATRLYVPGMLSDADQAYLDRLALDPGNQALGLGIAPLAIAAAAASFIHFGSSARYEGGPLVSTVLSFLGNQLRRATPDQARALVGSGAIGAGQKGWADVGAVLAPALRPDVWPQGPSRALTSAEMSMIAQVGGPVTAASAPAGPSYIPPSIPGPTTSMAPAPGSMMPISPAPAPVSLPYPAPAGYLPPPSPVVVQVPPGAPAPIQIPTGPSAAGIMGGTGSGMMLPLLIGGGLLLVVALSNKK